MCVVTSTALLVSSLAATAIGTGVSMYSSYTSGKQQQAYYNYQAQIAEQNAQTALENAAVERQTGIEEARLQRIKNLQAIGSRQTALAANGIDVTQGTALDIIEDTAAMGELDALQIQYNYEKKALAYEQEAENYSNTANLDYIASKNAYSSGLINTVTSGLNGVSSGLSVASKWTGFGS